MEIDSSDDDRSSFSDSSQTSHRYRGRRGGSGSGGLHDEPGGFSSPGGAAGAGGSAAIDSETGAPVVPPSQRGFTPDLTAAEAIKLAKQNALAAEARSAAATQPAAAAAAVLEGGADGRSGGGSGYPVDDG
ncbi:unnamed protein product, partial [Ectocarpus sp. 12 AP-2014]